MRVQMAKQAITLAGHHRRQPFPAFKGKHALRYNLATLRLSPRSDKGRCVIVQNAADSHFYIIRFSAPTGIS